MMPKTEPAGEMERQREEGGGRRGGGQSSRYTARERRNRPKHPGEELGVGRTPSI